MAGEQKTKESDAVGRNAEHPDVQPKIVLDDAHVCSLHADVAQVKAMREELWLFFGKIEKKSSEKNDRQAGSAVRVILSPFSAKRLAIALEDKIQKREPAHGPADEKVHKRSAQKPEKGSLRLPSFESPTAVDQVGRLLSLLKDLGPAVAVERSFKMFEKTLLDNRLLFAFKPESIRQSPREAILTMGVRMGMQKDFLDVFEKELPEATSVGFGIEENEETCVVKAYLEFKNRYKEALERGSGFHSYVSHLGFKWDAADTTRRALARYTCFPRFTVGNIVERVSKTFYPDGSQDFSFTVLKAIVDLASRKVGSDQFLYIEVNEENNPRSSFDINVYGANLRLQELFPLFVDMCDHHGVHRDRFLRVYEPVKTHILGHLAGGRDRKGRDFSTVYFSQD
jgi:hypothetical protein